MRGMADDVTPADPPADPPAPAPAAPAAPAAPVEEAPAADSAQAEPAAVAEAARDFGPEFEPERTVDVEAYIADGGVEFTVGEFAGSITGLAVVKGDGSVEALSDWTAREVAVGAAEVTAKMSGSGKTLVRLTVDATA